MTTKPQSNSNIDDLFPCISCGVNADPADGFGKCTCGNEAKREAIQQIIEARMIEFQSSLEEDYEQELLKAELKGFDKAFDSHDYDGLRKYKSDLQAKLMDTTRESE